MKKVLVLHGPNLNRLGIREPALYGSQPLSTLNHELTVQAKTKGVMLSAFQSNSEGALIDAIYQALDDAVNFILINPAAFTHTSIALRDALTSVAIPFYEVHITNIFARASFRHHSWFSDIARGTISGFGVKGYGLALQAILEEIS